METLLRRWRKRRGLSLRKLGARSGVSYVTVQRIEAGKMSPTLDTLEKLATALGLTVRDLIPKQTRPTRKGAR
jgi:transcriptional regulator with XRE-family HTH domain